jgi:hypothetical protein
MLRPNGSSRRDRLCALGFHNDRTKTMEMWRCEIRGEKVEVGEVGELALTNHSPYYILFFFFWRIFIFISP